MQGSEHSHDVYGGGVLAISVVVSVCGTEELHDGCRQVYNEQHEIRNGQVEYKAANVLKNSLRYL